MMFAAVLFSAAWQSNAYAAHEIVMGQEQIQHLGITLERVSPAASVLSDSMPAQVVIPPEQERVVSSSQSGLITSLRVAIGDEVKRGDVMALLESPELVALQRDYLQAAANLRLARADLKRDAQLFKEGIIAERRYLETGNRHEQARAALDEARQALLLAGLDAAALRELERTRKLSSVLPVRAPISGAVLAQEAVVGQRVDKSIPLYRIGKLEPLWLTIRVPVDRLGKMAPGTEVSLPCPQATARVIRIGRNVDPGNQTVLVRAEVHNGIDCVRPGQYIQVRMALLGADTQWRVPVAAVVRSGKQSVVFVRSTEGFRPLNVEVVGQESGYAVVRAALRGDEQVAASGLVAIKAVWLGEGGGE